jgi:hypothetical protein
MTVRRGRPFVPDGRGAIDVVHAPLDPVLSHFAYSATETGRRSVRFSRFYARREGAEPPHFENRPTVEEPIWPK